MIYKIMLIRDQYINFIQRLYYFFILSLGWWRAIRFKLNSTELNRKTTLCGSREVFVVRGAFWEVEFLILTSTFPKYSFNILRVMLHHDLLGQGYRHDVFNDLSILPDVWVKTSSLKHHDTTHSNKWWMENNDNYSFYLT